MQHVRQKVTNSYFAVCCYTVTSGKLLPTVFICLYERVLEMVVCSCDKVKKAEVFCTILTMCKVLLLQNIVVFSVFLVEKPTALLSLSSVNE
jgi:uncharacterized membrane protein YsdA (DUF1294 family)